MEGNRDAIYDFFINRVRSVTAELCRVVSVVVPNIKTTCNMICKEKKCKVKTDGWNGRHSITQKEIQN